MTDSWDQYAKEWDANEDALAYSRMAFDALCEVVNPVDLVVLDFGCGTGLLAEQIAEVASKVVAVDSSREMIRALRRKSLQNVEAVQGIITSEHYPSAEIRNNRFDLIAASSVCAFLPDYEDTLQVLRRLLKLNGVFIQWDWLRTKEFDAPTGFTEAEVKASLRTAGYAVISVRDVFSIGTGQEKKSVVMGVAKNA